MLVRQSDQIPSQKMQMPGAQDVTMRLLMGREDGVPNFSMRLFDVAPGGCTPHHQHNYEHEVMILEGAGEVVGGEKINTVRQGDVIYMPANEMHQFRNTGQHPLKFLCIVPTTHDCGKVTPGS